MSTSRPIAGLFAMCLATAYLMTVIPVGAEEVTQPQLQMLTPDERDLQGFVRVRPAGENPPRHGEASSAAPIPDQFWLELGQGKTVTAGQITKDQQGDVVSCVRRVMYSADGLYRLEIRTQVGETPQAAQREMGNYLRGSSAVFSPGKFSGTAVIGDESWFVPANIYGTSLIFRAGKTFIALNGGPSANSERNAGSHFVFPPGAVEAIAYQCLLRATLQPELTGITAQVSSLAVNDHTLPRGALKVAGRVYVPVQVFAKAMGLTSGWDTKTGALTLSGPKRKTVALTAGSTAATVGGAKAAALTVPVLKDGGEPVMALSDLLTLTGGRVTGHVGDTVQVKG